jgi:nitrate reductase NapD
MSSANLPSRRQLLTGRVIPPAPPEAHISSLVVHVRPEKVAGARAALGLMEGVEVHAEASGKMVVSLETATEWDIVARLNEISLLDGVMSASMVFHHFESGGEAGTPAKQE